MSNDISSKQSEFVKEAVEVSLYPVNSEIESLLLEARLIRLHQPFYNSIQKDDKSSLYLEISRESFPVIKMVRGGGVKMSSQIYGPFRTKSEADLVLRMARRVFRLCAATPKKGRKRRACFYYHIGLCDGACVGKVKSEEYRMRIGYLKRFLNGRSKNLLISLKRKIKKEAQGHRFEKAAEYKKMYEAIVWATQTRHNLAEFLRDETQTDQGVRSLKRLLMEFGMVTTLERIEGYDVATLQQKQTVGAMVVFFLGTAEKSEYRKFRMRNQGGGDTGAMREMLLRRFGHKDWPWPDLILVDGGKGQLAVAKKVVPDFIPVIGLAKKEEVVIVQRESKYEEIRLPRRSPALRLLQRVRDEAHRFGTNFHKYRRSKAVFT